MKRIFEFALLAMSLVKVIIKNNFIFKLLKTILLKFWNFLYRNGSVIASFSGTTNTTTDDQKEIRNQLQAAVQNSSDFTGLQIGNLKHP